MDDLGKNEFMGPFLVYPQEQIINKVLSKPEKQYKPVTYTKSLVKAGKPRYLKGKSGPIMMDASVTENVSPGKVSQLEVRLNLSPDKIESVTYSHSGFPWMGKVSLEYNDDKKMWIADIVPGDRWRIQESENVFVWAVGIDGLYSEFYPVKVGWDFK